MRSQDDELLLTGHAVPGDGALVDLLDSLRAMAHEPAPAPTAELAALLEAGLPPRVAPVPFAVLVGRAVRRRASTAGRWIGGLGLTGKVVLGAGVAMAAVTGAATIPAVPDVVQQPAHTVLVDVGRVFGGGVEPAPAPSSSAIAPHRDGTHRTGLPDDVAGETTGSVGDAGAEPATSAGSADAKDGRDGSRPEQGRSPAVAGTGSPAVAGQGTSTERGSSGDRTSSGSSGDRSSSDQAPATSSNDWMTRKQDVAPAPSPEPSSSPSPKPDASPSPSEH
ncbi:hypothetical protein [Cellulomonas sp. SG140]|uniref:hypothetical protein n=1 Tax=Cellulomonas sp. SG140 TaxID=2976536 RepID=UPI0021E88422|nr:hypothetical protein [Cellulomonas sp. SG140]